MQYPVQIRFKLFALAPQLDVFDAEGNAFCHVRQELFRFKEAITIYRDKTKQEPVFQINADRIIDFNANYLFTSASGTSLGSIRRRGMRSLWRAHYELFDGERLSFTLSEENPWIKLLDGVLDDIPVIGLFIGYFLNPTYLITDPAGNLVFRVTKKRAFLESRFTIDQLAEVQPADEMRTLLGVIMMVLLERRRG